jgi:predicted phage replisome organizer
MGEVKWIKLSVDIFDDEKIEAIGTLPDGNMIQLVWIKLLCLAGKCNEGGLLMVTRELPYTDEMLAKRFDMEIGQVQRALDIFQRAEMIEVIENIYMVSNWAKYQSTQSLEEMKAKHRERQRNYVERKKQKLMEEKKKEDDIKDDVICDVTMTDSCSYSLSNKHNFNTSNNLNNYRYLIDNNVYKESIYIKDRPELDAVISDWMTYKDGMTPKSKNKYSSQMSMSKVLTVIIKHDKEYGTDAVREVVDLSISNQWVGILWDKIEKQGYRKPMSEPTREVPTGLEKPKKIRQ